jgi:predicted metalloprotease
MMLPKLFRGGLAVGAFAALSIVMPGSASYVTSDLTTPAKEPAIEVTDRDVAASNHKIALAYTALVDMWTSELREVGVRFTAPRVVRYTGRALTPCGVVPANNAEYCPSRNAIVYDEVFVAAMAKSAAHSLGTDGDMAAVGVIAHEMGHAVALQLGHWSRSSYENEATADCLAGAFARQSEHDGSLESGDIDEAFYGMSLAGDPTIERTGNPRYDRLIQARLARQSHGTKDQRMQNFRTGLDGGPSACLEELR